MKRKKLNKIVNQNFIIIINIYQTYGFIQVKKWLYENFKIKLTLELEEELLKIIKIHYKLKKTLRKILMKLKNQD